MIRANCLFAAVLVILPSVHAFGVTPQSPLSSIRQGTSLNAEKNVVGHFLASAAIMTAIAMGGPALADEVGKETEAPTLFTGETVMICKQRGPLGACTKTEERTKDNDNDRASAYFVDPGNTQKQRQDADLMIEESKGNALIQKLRQQSDDNREKNELQVLQKTLINDMSASFGPFDRQTVILNTDGRTFTLLENPQAMRLKNAGFIEDRKFVKQPTEEEIAAALVLPENEGGLGGLVKSIFGGETAVVEDTAVVEAAAVVEDTAVVETAADTAVVEGN